MSQLSFESCSVLIEGLEYSSVFFDVGHVYQCIGVVLFCPFSGTVLRGL